MTATTERVLYLVWTWLPEDQAAAWDAWHTQTHMPEVVAQPWVRRAYKYRVIDDNTPATWAAYVTTYEFDSWADWEAYNTSAAAARLRQDYVDRYGAVGKIARQMLVETAAVAGD
jgi:hypothetical protein